MSLSCVRPHLDSLEGKMDVGTKGTFASSCTGALEEGKIRLRHYPFQNGTKSTVEKCMARHAHTSQTWPTPNVLEVNASIGILSYNVHARSIGPR